MNLTPFQIINFLIILVVLALIIRYAWGVMFDKNYQPDDWQAEVKAEKIPLSLIRLEKQYADKVRFFNRWFQIRRIEKDKIPGAFAELGVYKGESAKIIHQMAPGRKFHLFDTFEGFSSEDLKVEWGEAATYSTANFADTSLAKVERNIEGDEQVVFHKGYFPKTAVGLENETFAFVNMDADLYNPTKAGLEFFYPRLSSGGVIIIHDYTHKWEGIQKAVDEFLRTIPANLVPVPDMNGSVMIFK